jgi:hypothetical protein
LEQNWFDPRNQRVAPLAQAEKDHVFRKLPEKPEIIGGLHAKQPDSLELLRAQMRKL